MVQQKHPKSAEAKGELNIKKGYIGCGYYIKE